MQLTQKLPNSQWIAHDNKTTDVLPKTLRQSLVECMASYIWQHIVPTTRKNMITRNLLNTGEKPTHYDLVDEFEDQIPPHIKFIIVTLEPRWETQKNA